MADRYDFVAIGDTVTDAFIKLQDTSAHIDIDHGTREICMRFGDKIPYDDVFVVPGVGNSANAAVSAARLGLASALVANVGDDYFGTECLNVFRAENVETKFIAAHAGYKTNYHYVLWYGSDRTILVKHQDYPYRLPDIGEPRWIYLSSLGPAAEPLHADIARYLEDHSSVKLAFQPGTYQMKMGREKLGGIYRRTEAFFCNKEEAQRILETDEADIKALMRMIADLGPKIVAITDGVNGACAYDGAQAWRMPLYPDPKPPLQRTGAGDAFSSTFTVALMLGKSVPEALAWGPVNSMSVVQGIGARQGLVTRPRLEELLKEAPSDYRPSAL
jgi:ribokinase